MCPPVLSVSLFGPFFSRHVLNSFDGVPDHLFSTANVRHRIYEKVYESSGHRESRAMVPRSPRRTGSRVLDPTEDPGDVDPAGIPNSPATMAPSESYPPLFITSADAFKNSGVQPGAVEEGDRISPAPRIPKS